MAESAFDVRGRFNLNQLIRSRLGESSTAPVFLCTDLDKAFPLLLPPADPPRVTINERDIQTLDLYKPWPPEYFQSRFIALPPGFVVAYDGVVGQAMGSREATEEADAVARRHGHVILDGSMIHILNFTTQTLLAQGESTYIITSNGVAFSAKKRIQGITYDNTAPDSILDLLPALGCPLRTSIPPGFWESHWVIAPKGGEPVYTGHRLSHFYVDPPQAIPNLLHRAPTTPIRKDKKRERSISI
jgi:hypothetical protein